jgi:hypothetical protein
MFATASSIRAEAYRTNWPPIHRAWTVGRERMKNKIFETESAVVFICFYMYTIIAGLTLVVSAVGVLLGRRQLCHRRDLRLLRRHSRRRCRHRRRR